ncbi:AAA family ATPase, partial [Succinimonas sp.]|uniref:AAA family ATPase n=1 Tax=Succinimonas sp. TaxID=1936151 RepID=UPI0038671949
MKKSLRFYHSKDKKVFVMPKKIPIAMTDFKKIIEKNYAFVEKTRFLEVYENSGTTVSMFLRPRRFGKTMFTELLRYYYDIALKEEADRLFKGKYIASHPTPRKNSYYVLQFDLSGVDTHSSDSLTRTFIKRVLFGISDFFARYPKSVRGFLPNSVSESRDELRPSAITAYYENISRFPAPSVIMLDFFLRISGFIPSNKLMVIVDEYDNFSNGIDMLGRAFGDFQLAAEARQMLAGFFNTLRSGNQDHLIDRIFVTGVVPINMDNTVSGFVSEQISFYNRFNEMAGFTDDEVMELLKETVDFEKCPFSPEVLRGEIKRRYNGYRCADNAKNTVCNAAMCLNFIDELISNDYRKIPSFQMFADDGRDYRRLCEFLMLMDEQARNKLIEDLNNRKPVRSNAGMAVKLKSEHETFGYLEGGAILYYLGFLTIMSEEEKQSHPFCDPQGEYLTIANEYFRNLFARFQLASSPKVLCEIEKLSNLGKMPVSNDISVLSDMLYRVADSFTQTEVSREGENEFALAIYTAISMAAGSSFELTKEYAIKHGGKFVFEDGLTEEEYADVPDNESETSPENSEPESEFEEFVRSFTMPRRDDINTRRGRADLVAINTNPQGPSYIFEFKYKRNTRTSEMTKDKVREALYNRAVKQLN